MRVVVIDNFYVRKMFNSVITDSNIASVINTILEKLSYSYIYLLYELFTSYSSRYTEVKGSEIETSFPYVRLPNVDPVGPSLQAIISGDVYDIIMADYKGYTKESSFNKFFYDDVYTLLSNHYSAEIAEVFYDDAVKLLSDAFVGIETDLLKHHFTNDNSINSVYLYLVLDVDTLIVQTS